MVRNFGALGGATNLTNSTGSRCPHLHYQCDYDRCCFARTHERILHLSVLTMHNRPAKFQRRNSVMEIGFILLV